MFRAVCHPLTLVLAVWCVVVPGSAAEVGTQGQSFDLGIDEVPDLPEMLRPLDSVCRRVLNDNGRKSELNE